MLINNDKIISIPLPDEIPRMGGLFANATIRNLPGSFKWQNKTHRIIVHNTFHNRSNNGDKLPNCLL